MTKIRYILSIMRIDKVDKNVTVNKFIYIACLLEIKKTKNNLTKTNEREPISFNSFGSFFNIFCKN